MSSKWKPIRVKRISIEKVKIEHNKLERNITYLSLSRNIAEKPDNIIFGNGSDEFRNLLCF